MTSHYLCEKAVLIVEEDCLLARDIQAALEQAGAEGLIARGTREALDRIERFEFAVAAVNLWPLSNNHLAIARRLKHGSIPFLFYDARPSQTSAAKAKKGASHGTQLQQIVGALRYLVRAA